MPCRTSKLNVIDRIGNQELKKLFASCVVGQNKLLLSAALIYLLSTTITRVTLLILQSSNVDVSVVDYLQALLSGVTFDIYVASGFALLYSLFMLVFPKKWLQAALGRWLTFGGFFIFVYGAIYLIVVELFFFDEFSSRLNYVAVDYLVYPHEVFVNLWDTYPVGTVLIVDLILSVAVVWLSRRLIVSALENVASFGVRLRSSLALLAVCGAFYLLLNIDTSRVSDNRVLNEIAGNGVYNFFHAFVTNELDYEVYYATIDESEAIERVRRQVKTADAEFVVPDVKSLNSRTLSSRTLTRHIESDEPARRFNIVLVLEESFGSEFIGSLRPEGVNITPHFDSLADEGMLFTNIYATGNRTVRGLEASVISFPPIPGRSIVKRPANEGLFTLASALKTQDYQTVFLYGGHAYFDNFAHFASNNSYDKVLDETDFSIKTFSTIWGVCDEDLFDNALMTFDSLHAQKKPFFATMITVSNHSPFTYPEGRIPFNPQKQFRKFAVRYADYAIGKFIADAKSHEFFDSTLFVFMADHGARVYGRQEIPMDSYEIPLLFYAPALFPAGSRNNRLGSQLDLAPTILDLLDFSYNSSFFGRSMLRQATDDDWILLSHNRDVAMLRNDTLAVLGILGGAEIWLRDSQNGKFTLLGEDSESSLAKDAISYFQVGYGMYKEGLLESDQGALDSTAETEK